MRAVHEVIASVCRMPFEFYRGGDVSILRLAEDSDYRAHQTVIGVEDIQQYLQAHPKLVEDWDMYSANKRTSRG